MRIYKCPRCEFGRRAPEKMHREDARRFCFGCSERTGRLVRLIAPTIEDAKAAKKEARKKKAQERRDRERRKKWERLHTWPGVRELRWNPWAVPGTPNKGELPVVRGATSIPDAYADMFRLGMPRMPSTGDTSKAVAARRAYLQRVRYRTADGTTRPVISDKEHVEVIAYDTNTKEFHRALDAVRSHAYAWLLEDLGIEDPTAIAAVRGVAEKTNPSDPDHVRILNNVITNALVIDERNEKQKNAQARPSYRLPNTFSAFIQEHRP